MAIDWNSFNVAIGEQVTYIQPNANALSFEQAGLLGVRVAKRLLMSLRVVRAVLLRQHQCRLCYIHLAVT